MHTDILRVLRQHAASRGGALAVECDGQQLTFQELDERSDRCARALRTSGANAGDRVAFLAPSCVEHFVFLFGAIKAGAVAVPVNWRLAPPEIAAVLADAEAALLVVGGALVERIEALEPELTSVRTIISIEPHDRYPSWPAWLDQATGEQAPAAGLDDDTIVLQIYTSGTTGKPKGVMTSSAAMSSYLETLASVARFHSEATSLSTMPLFHIGGTGWVLGGLYRGASTIVLRDLDADRILRLIDERSVTNLIAVPAVIQRLLASPALASTIRKSLITVYYGGGPMTEQVLRRALETFGCDFVQGFGMTECALISSLPPEDHLGAPENLRSCGRPVPGTSIRLVDAATGVDVEPGAVGEIWVRSPQVMAGYWRQPDAMREALVDGWLRTGDAARQDAEGRLFMQDRIKDMIVSGGENVYAAEVENALMRHPAVTECAVIGVPSEVWTETVKAVVVLNPDAEVNAAELIRHCRTLLASYKCPTSVDIVGTLPRTPSGKVLKYELRKRYAEHS